MEQAHKYLDSKTEAKSTVTQNEQQIPNQVNKETHLLCIYV